MSLSPVAVDVAHWLAAQCQNGLPEPIGDELLSAFSDTPKSELEEALAELEEDGFVDLTHVLGPALPRVRATPELLFQFDPAVCGTNPAEDAGYLAQLILDDDEMAHVPTLHTKSGWNYRQFNPALLYILQFFDEGRCSASIQNEYATRSLIVGPTERVRLRRFLEELVLD
jgi:hypothetical protein